jgi:hypothetical protein
MSALAAVRLQQRPRSLGLTGTTVILPLETSVLVVTSSRFHAVQMYWLAGVSIRNIEDKHHRLRPFHRRLSSFFDDVMRFQLRGAVSPDSRGIVKNVAITTAYRFY